jgi:hypothetical protein
VTVGTAWWCCQALWYDLLQGTLQRTLTVVLCAIFWSYSAQHLTVHVHNYGTTYVNPPSEFQSYCTVHCSRLVLPLDFPLSFSPHCSLVPLHCSDTGLRYLPRTYVLYLFLLLITIWSTRWRSVWGTALQTGRSRVRFPMVSLHYFIDIILPVALGPWSQLNLQQKWVPGIFPGGKGGQCVGLTTLPPSCADCLNIWEPQPPGSLMTCQGL